MAELRYEVNTKFYVDLKDFIKAPKFQRNFVWKKKQRKQLIESIKNGLPIGSFLLQQKKDGTYSIIDGRQRFSTLIDYEKHRYDYIDDNDITNEKIIDLLNSVPEIKSRYDDMSPSAKKRVIDDIRKAALKLLKTKDATEAETTYDILNTITSKFVGLGKDAERKLNANVAKFYKTTWQVLNVDNITLPCIIFKDNVDDNLIITTFINLNTKGTKLSKYDLYSAQWQNDFITVDDQGIIEKVISKYKDSLENNQNIDTEGFNETQIRESKEINVFEYAYALSKLIGDKCNKMYEIKDASEVDSLGFSILAGVLDVPSKNMNGLSSKLVKSKIDFIDLKDKIIECSHIIQSKLEYYCETPANKLVFDHSINQLVSYIVTLFKAKYTIDSDGKIKINNKNDKINDFYKNLPYWYLYDNIRGYWLGSGDTKLDNMVLTDDIFKSPYFGIVSEDSFRAILLDWIDDKNNEKGKTIDAQTKLFINYIIKKRCNEPHSNMDYEHIVPQARIESTISKARGVSSPANLTHLPRFDNRLKRDKTYYELIQSRDQTALSYDKNQLEKYIYPEHSELKFIESKENFTIENFTKFKNDRKNTLINIFFKLYY